VSQSVQLGAYAKGRAAGEELLLPYYEAALEEIAALRRALALEAHVCSARYELLPYQRDQVKRMRSAARGHVQRAYGDISVYTVGDAVHRARSRLNLTRVQWEREVDKRGHRD